MRLLLILGMRNKVKRIMKSTTQDYIVSLYLLDRGPKDKTKKKKN